MAARRVQRGSYRPLRHAVTLTDADRRVLRLLEQQPLRVWPRDVLAEAAGLGDRAMRQCVEHLRHAGIAIVSSSSGRGGYKVAANVEEIERFRGELLSRMRVIQQECDVLDQIARLMKDRRSSGPEAALVALL